MLLGKKDLIMRGKVIMFNGSKGFGFISVEDGSDIFFHCSQLLIPGQTYKTVDVDTEVEFDLEETERGLRAANIRIVK